MPKQPFTNLMLIADIWGRLSTAAVSTDIPSNRLTPSDLKAIFGLEPTNVFN